MSQFPAPSGNVTALPVIMVDPSSGLTSASDGPATRAVAVVPSDATTLTPPTRAIYVGGSGNLVLTTSGGDLVTFSVGAGMILPVQAVKVMAATTATSIVAMW
jgi:hypothetical protein